MNHALGVHPLLLLLSPGSAYSNLLRIAASREWLFAYHSKLLVQVAYLKLHDAVVTC